MKGVMKNKTTMIKLAKDGIKRPWVWNNFVFQYSIQQTTEDAPISTLSFSSEKSINEEDLDTTEKMIGGATKERRQMRLSIRQTGSDVASI